MIFTARVKKVTVNAKGKGEDTVKVGQIVLEYEDLDDWQLEMLGEHIDGMKHEIAIDEDKR